MHLSGTVLQECCTKSVGRFVDPHSKIQHRHATKKTLPEVAWPDLLLVIHTERNAVVFSNVVSLGSIQAMVEDQTFLLI